VLGALIFDVDGTLADTEELHRQAFNAAFRNMGYDWNWGSGEYRALLEISGGKERIRHYISTLDLPPAKARAADECIPLIHREKTRIYKELLERGVALRPGISPLIVDARKAGMKLAIATTTTLDNVHALLDSAQCVSGGVGSFDAVGAGDLVAHKKPAPDIYNLVLSTLRIPRGQCVAFEDSVNGLRAAKAAGLFTVVTPTQWNADHDFSGADLLLPADGAGVPSFATIANLFESTRSVEPHP
jgi:HAD superfamily hydrolase (TIGR01509 family)